MIDFNEVIRRIQEMPISDRVAFQAQCSAEAKDQCWFPNPGAQTDAYFSEADELFYGGEAGGGKTDLLLGVGLNNHNRTLILRRQNNQVAAMIDRLEEIVGSKNIKRNPPAHYRTREKIILFSGCQHLQDREKHRGVAKDFIGFDEITGFIKDQYTFITAWCRSTKKGQRVRVIVTGNPPNTAEGMWVIEYWAPWLDKNHPNPALPGELRYFTNIDGKEVEVDGPGPVIVDGVPLLSSDGGPVIPKSRTFIPAGLEDNPDLAETGYASTLDALPDELKQSLREGEFSSSMLDSPFQVFPAEWVEAAMNRWNPTGEQAPMSVLAVDIAQGGSDRTTRAPRHGNWFGRIKSSPGKETPDGPTVAAIIVNERRNGCEIILDMGGGYGGSTNDHLKSNNMTPTLYNGSNSADGHRDRSGMLKFYNTRAAAHWKLREALDPALGSTAALPPDPELKAEMVSIRYKITPRGVQVEEKVAVKARIGRSPDKSDAVVMCNWAMGVTSYFRGATSSRQTKAVTSGRNPRRR